MPPFVEAAVSILGLLQRTKPNTQRPCGFFLLINVAFLLLTSSSSF